MAPCKKPPSGINPGHRISGHRLNRRWHLLFQERSMEGKSQLFYPPDAASIRDEIRDFLRYAVADADTSLDGGGGFGEAEVFVSVGGKKYTVSVKEAG